MGRKRKNEVWNVTKKSRRKCQLWRMIKATDVIVSAAATISTNDSFIPKEYII